MSSPAANEDPLICWNEAGAEKSARWHSESGSPPPKRVVIADDTMTADTAYRLACEGTALLWRGDFQNARQLLQAMTRRANEKPRKPPKKIETPREAFNLYRLAQSQRAKRQWWRAKYPLDHALPSPAWENTGEIPDRRSPSSRRFYRIQPPCFPWSPGL